MADYLSSAEWKKVLKEHKDVKAPGIVTQLDAYQKAETKKLSEQMAAVTEKLDALQQSVASMPAPSVAAPVTPPKARHQ